VDDDGWLDDELINQSIEHKNIKEEKENGRYSVAVAVAVLIIFFPSDQCVTSVGFTTRGWDRAWPPSSSILSSLF